MAKQKHKAPHARSAAPKYPGISADAKTLGVSRTHLFLVLTGKRKSARLMSRYLALTSAAA
jgi:hypothetical protein